MDSSSLDQANTHLPVSSLLGQLPCAQIQDLTGTRVHKASLEPAVQDNRQRWHHSVCILAQSP